MAAQPSILAFLPSLGLPEMIVIGIVALLIFGRRLPEVGRSVGKSIVEFKKGLKETEETIKDADTGDRASGTAGEAKQAGRTDAKDSGDSGGSDKPDYKLT